MCNHHRHVYLFIFYFMFNLRTFSSLFGCQRAWGDVYCNNCRTRPNSKDLIASEFLRSLMKHRGKTGPSAQSSRSAGLTVGLMTSNLLSLCCIWTEGKPEVVMLHISIPCLQYSSVHVDELCALVMITWCLHTTLSA